MRAEEELQGQTPRDVQSGKGSNEVLAEDSRLNSTLLFMQYLWSLTNALQASSKRMEAELGITGPQRLALRLLGRMPGASPSELADVLRVHPSTLTGVLKRLDDASLVARSADPDDARKRRLGLTAKGEAMDRECAGTVEAAVRRAMTRSSDADLHATERVLGTLVEELRRGSG